MAKRGRPKQTTARRAVTRRSETAEETPAVWLSQLKDGVNYGVRDYGRLGRRTTERAIAEFLRVKAFVEVELPQITAENNRALMAASAEFQVKKKGTEVAPDAGGAETAQTT